MSEFSPPRVITTPRILLRSWSPSDVDALQRALDASDAHLRAWTPWVIDGKIPGMSLAERLAQHEAAFAQGTEWVYGIFSVDDQAVLGGCGLYPRVGPRAVEVGYWLAENATGRGYASEAAGELTRVALASPEIDAVEIRVDSRNAPSVNVARRLGYEFVGVVDEAKHAGTTLMRFRRLA